MFQVPNTWRSAAQVPLTHAAEMSTQHSAEDRMVRQNQHQTMNENPAGNTETLPAHLQFSFPIHRGGFFFVMGMHSLLMWCSREVMNILKTTAEIKFPIIFPRSVTNKAGNSDWVRKKYWSTVLLLLFNKKKKQQCNRVSHVMNNSHNGS